MLWRANNDLIYVMNNAGNWAVFKDIYVEGAPEPGGYAVPAGLQAPVRGFDAIWRERLGGPNVRDRLGHGARACSEDPGAGF